MAVITLSQFRARQFGGGGNPYGNLSTLRFLLETNASGAAVGANSIAPIAQGDVVDLGPLPEGFVLQDFHLIVSTGLSAGVTGSLGFQYADGKDSAAVPQDAAYFGAGLDLATAARLRTSSAKAVVALPKPARLILTVAGANNAKAGKVDVVLYGELSGNQ